MFAMMIETDEKFYSDSTTPTPMHDLKDKVKYLELLC